MLLPLAAAAAYCLPPWLPDPPLAFYIARGWLGCLFAWALLRGWRINALTFAALAGWEASSSLCGAFFADLTPVAVGSLCDKGAGLPLTLPSLALTLAACVYRPKHNKGGRDA